MAMSRSAVARLGAHESWARTTDRAARTRPAREAFLARFEREVDPNGELLPSERARRAEHARRAHMQRLAAASARSRAIKNAGAPRAAAPSQPSVPASVVGQPEGEEVRQVQPPSAAA